MLTINTLVPVVAIIFLGAVLRSTKFMTADIFRANNRLVYWIALPCLLFYKTATASAHGTAAMRVFLILVGGMFVCVILGYLCAWLLHLPDSSRSVFVQGAYRGNLVYVGIPVILFALAGTNGQYSGEMESLAILSIAPLIPIYNIAAVIILLAGQKRSGISKRRHLQTVLLKVTKNPLVLSCVAGIGYSFTGWQLPLLVHRTCIAIGKIALPLALLGIGASLSFKAVQNGLAKSLTSSIIKVVCGPLIMFFIGKQLGLNHTELQIAILFLACPTATASFIMAEELGADGKLASSIVVTSTLMSMLSLAIILMFV
ncbi:AEC family transporter [bacterium]|nr:AEC family transporter [bacterium]